MLRDAFISAPKKRAAVLLVGATLSGLLTLSFNAGCASESQVAAAVPAGPIDQTLHAGDVLRIAFPGTQGLDTTQPVRRDGKINLSMVGEVTVENKTPAELEKELIALYASQLVS